MIRPQDVNLMFMEAFNKRLDASLTNMDEVWEELYRRNMSMHELLAIVEKEGWQYSNGLNYVCSTFLVSVYRRAGLFGDLQIESTEFTPKDLYELDFFDVSGGKVPSGCEDYNFYGYCQIMGKVKLNLGEVSHVKPYEHMDERCPTVAPNYSHKDGC